MIIIVKNMQNLKNLDEYYITSNMNIIYDAIKNIKIEDTMNLKFLVLEDNGSCRVDFNISDIIVNNLNHCESDEEKYEMIISLISEHIFISDKIDFLVKHVNKKYKGYNFFIEIDESKDMLNLIISNREYNKSKIKDIKKEIYGFCFYCGITNLHCYFKEENI